MNREICQTCHGKGEGDQWNILLKKESLHFLL